MNIENLPEKVLESLAISNKVAILTGAGISAESGIKTFRDPDGLWTKFNPAELASMDGFMANPNLVWEWYQYRRKIISESKPNPGHYAIAEMQELFPTFTLITQNVDRLHQSSGSRNVIELHGNIIDNYCVKCKIPYEDKVGLDSTNIPLCVHCGSKIRPAVVWYGEMLPAEAILKGEIAAKQSEFFFSIGTSSEVYPAASLPLIAKDSGAIVVEINPNETSLSRYADYSIKLPSGTALPNIVNRLKQIKGLLL